MSDRLQGWIETIGALAILLAITIGSLWYLASVVRRIWPHLIAMLFISGCVNASLVCPDGKSTVTYRGLSLTGSTAVSCVAGANGGDVVQITGVDLIALAAAVAPLVAQKAPVQK
jgi:hypothetical protein